VTEEIVAKLGDGYEASDLAPRQKAILRWTDACLAVPPRADPELREEMLRHFTPEQIVELTAGIALFMGFSKIAVSLGQVPGAMPVLVMPTPDWPEGAASGG
jgi:alkylhydroperoxidase family enzyme